MPGRSRILTIKKGILVIDETYNANPRSMEVALRTLREVKGKGRGIAVLGDMKELGDTSPFWHREIGKCARALGTEYLVLLGEFAPFIAEGAESGGAEKGKIFIGKNHEDAVLQVQQIMRRGDWILIKGSRGMQMEKVLNPLAEQKGKRRAL
jgi:UDP-N-acetylmuramoyl-tripeptide--D-alanyl-D-alanine ligase